MRRAWHRLAHPGPSPGTRCVPSWRPCGRPTPRTGPSRVDGLAEGLSSRTAGWARSRMPRATWWRGAASALTVRLTVPGGEVGAAGVTGVGTRPDYHRRGVLRALMRRQLEDVRERGEPVAILWASEGAIYQRFGYGLAAMDGFFEVATRRTQYTRTVPRRGPRAHRQRGGSRRPSSRASTRPCAG